MHIRLSLLLVIVCLIGAASPSGALDLEFKGDAAVGLCCLEPGTDVLFFGLVWQERPWVARISVLRAIEMVAKGDDTAWFEPDIGVPESSYWIGADLSTGAYTVAARTNKQLEEKTIPPENLARDGQRSIFAFDVEAGYLEVVVIRPGQAAWAYTAGDGSAFDADGQSDGWVRAEIGSFRPIDNGPEAPKFLETGDVILALDTSRGILSTTTIDG
ncbi:MAG: hypothetical protein DRJ65_05520 [Acidobacteria bacterium]|nr:MAG: hypothetical protein DRJ65_05520 [Acidobacteriota bacterium]